MKELIIGHPRNGSVLKVKLIWKWRVRYEHFMHVSRPELKVPCSNGKHVVKRVLLCDCKCTNDVGSYTLENILRNRGNNVKDSFLASKQSSYNSCRNIIQKGPGGLHAVHAHVMCRWKHQT